MRCIYVSPHFDDAVLSCGGLIWEQVQKGMPVEIWTVCAGDAPPGPLSALAKASHQQWNIEAAEDLVPVRRIENQEAATLVGAETVNFSIPDCIYRRSSAADLLYPTDVFVPIHTDEKNLDAEIAGSLTSELQPDDVIISPLAIGGHVDHVLTRLAAEHLNRPIRYYADIPYLIKNPEMLVPATKGLIGTLYPISENGLGIWQESIAAYATQILMLFDTREKMQNAIRIYWENQRGVQLWNAIFNN